MFYRHIYIFDSYAFWIHGDRIKFLLFLLDGRRDGIKHIDFPAFFCSYSFALLSGTICVHLHAFTVRNTSQKVRFACHTRSRLFPEPFSPAVSCSLGVALKLFPYRETKECIVYITDRLTKNGILSLPSKQLINLDVTSHGKNTHNRHHARLMPFNFMLSLLLLFSKTSVEWSTAFLSNETMIFRWRWFCCVGSSCIKVQLVGTHCHLLIAETADPQERS